MRDYIILNGTRSTLIRGLMICSLPPITKPALRTTTTTIDGRDGDIVTPLGYQSYDKEIEIGLHGDYDVDEVIKYFDGSGTVTFSNEITKYYRYRIDSQIDFEKLIRFRTAKVKFHVQPFKYSTTELPFEWLQARPIVSVPGYNNSLFKNGIVCHPVDGGASLRIAGTATADTELYIPISELIVRWGEYLYEASTNAESVGAENITMRLIYGTPTDANSFGDEVKEFQLINGESPGITDTIPEYYSGHYDYIWMNIPSGATVATVITPTIQALKDGLSGKKIVRAPANTGNVISRPKFTIYGSGTVKLTNFKSSTDAPSITVSMLGTSGSITIDTETEEAYDGSVLKNRNVTGDMRKLAMDPGGTTIIAEITSDFGLLDKIVLENYSRWL